MKKFISLALAAAMTLSLVPVSAFASTDNRISKVVTVQKDDVLATNAPEIVIMNDKGDIKKGEDFTFELVLDGAEWDTIGAVEVFEANTEGSNGITEDAKTENLASEGGAVKVEKINSKRALVSVDVKDSSIVTQDAGLRIVLKGVKVTGDKATVTIDPKQSTVSADTFTFAKSEDGATITTVDGTKDFYDGGEVNDIFIEEVTTGTLKDGDKITLKLNSGFAFGTNAKASIVSGDGSIKLSASEDLSSPSTEISVKPVDDDTRTIEFYVDGITEGEAVTDAQSAIIKISGITIDEDGADFGKVAEITVSGSNVDKTTLEMGTLIDFGVAVSAEDKDLPVIYSGNDIEDDNNETLKLTIKENVADSWLTDTRKTTFTFPEGVKVISVEVDDTDNIKLDDADFNDGIDKNVVTLPAATKYKSDETGKAEVSLIFNVVTAPDFTGDIKCTVGGPAVSEDTEVTLAKAVAPVTVEAEKTSVAIDYRNVEVGDITVKEAEAGLWGKNQVIVLEAENMTFESGMTAEIVEGDGEIKKLDVKDGQIKITVDSESSKTPMTIKLSNASLYLDRSLPAGDYALNLVAYGKVGEDGKTVEYKDSVMFETYGSDNTKNRFDVDEVEVVKDYVTVATAGRDQGTTFTTNVVVTIDSTTMLVDGKEVTLDVPAYLSAEGWTMLPVRAVTESLASASNSEPVDWIAGNPGTIMIYYGDKTVSMTLGSTTMYINGTPVPMSTAPVIVNDRAFLPMRDLGRALGLSDSQIAWDATARTATFNPIAE